VIEELPSIFQSWTVSPTMVINEFTMDVRALNRVVVIAVYQDMTFAIQKRRAIRSSTGAMLRESSPYLIIELSSEVDLLRRIVCGSRIHDCTADRLWRTWNRVTCTTSKAGGRYSSSMRLAG
jgi:hypothetical protein